MIAEQKTAEKSSTESREDDQSSSSESCEDDQSSDSSKYSTCVEPTRQDDSESREQGAGEEGLDLAFTNASIRAAFVRKVFALVTSVVIVNIILTMPVLFIEELRLFLVEHGWMQSVALLVFLVTYFSAICCSPVFRRFPCNIMMLVIFTFSAAAMLIAICASVPPYTVVLALTTTAATTFAVIIFASQTLYDTTSYTFVIFAISIAAFIFGTFLVFMSMFLITEVSPNFNTSDYVKVSHIQSSSNCFIGNYLYSFYIPCSSRYSASFCIVRILVSDDYG
uniref:Equilibrative nucleoside transporter 1 n=1 Tax=Haemonchus contortus TaxID=6289 RepID=A0A7I5E8Y3_HAECO